jgi:hypothetical protein
LTPSGNKNKNKKKFGEDAPPPPPPPRQHRAAAEFDYAPFGEKENLFFFIFTLL